MWQSAATVTGDEKRGEVSGRALGIRCNENDAVGIANRWGCFEP
jgi:hypothetical protein